MLRFCLLIIAILTLEALRRVQERREDRTAYRRSDIFFAGLL